MGCGAGLSAGDAAPVDFLEQVEWVLPGLKPRTVTPGLPTFVLDVSVNGLFGHVFMGSNCGKNSFQSSDSEGIVLGNRDAVGRGMRGLKDDVTADLMDFLVFPTLAELLDQLFSAQFAWEFHATASTSSRIR